MGRAIGNVSSAPTWARCAVFGVLALSVPVAAYAVSGMETAIASALATFAVLERRRPLVAAVLAGLAASLRPEMAPWACALALGFAVETRLRPAQMLAALSLAAAPFTACALVRTVVWGRPAPLALLAKPSDASHGLIYGGAACVVTLVPLLALAPRSLRRTQTARTIIAAGAVHVVSTVVAGGDWMPYARLMVPIIPGLAYAAVLLAACARPAATAVRSAIALDLGAVLLVRGGAGGRTVGADRAALIAVARPVLAGTKRVAALDVGWTGAATDGDVVDLAGVTDPEVAALPGGHTSKRIDAMFLLARHPDALLLYAPPQAFPRNSAGSVAGRLLRTRRRGPARGRRRVVSGPLHPHGLAPPRDEWSGLRRSKGPSRKRPVPSPDLVRALGLTFECEAARTVADIPQRARNDTTLRYVVEGCGKRGLYLEQCDLLPGDLMTA